MERRQEEAQMVEKVSEHTIYDTQHIIGLGHLGMNVVGRHRNAP